MSNQQYSKDITKKFFQIFKEELLSSNSLNYLTKVRIFYNLRNIQRYSLNETSKTVNIQSLCQRDDDWDRAEQKFILLIGLNWTPKYEYNDMKVILFSFHFFSNAYLEFYWFRGKFAWTFVVNGYSQANCEIYTVY